MVTFKCGTVILKNPENLLFFSNRKLHQAVSVQMKHIWVFSYCTYNMEWTSMLFPYHDIRIFDNYAYTLQFRCQMSLTFTLDIPHLGKVDE